MPVFDPFRPQGFPLIGVLHLAPLPGSPRWAGDLQAIRDKALQDAAAYADGGFDALIVENYGDRPFSPGAVPPATVAAMTAIALAVRERFSEIPLGVNVLRNDAQAALAVATVVGGSFVRVNVLVGAMIADQGILEGKAWELALAARLLEAKVAIWADVMVKHAAPLGSQTLLTQADDAFWRAGAAGLVLSGAATGKPADPADFDAVRSVLPDAPLILGSGLDETSLERFASRADAAIVATSLQGSDGSVDRQKVRRLIDRRNSLL
ncbi:MAG: BtpA/SgcQ family protein [Cyanobacteria bacterium REEB65]|nr:BtpA/SgcQ family protein [Cyanobacteria bacterium REEB65]